MAQLSALWRVRFKLHRYPGVLTGSVKGSDIETPDNSEKRALEADATVSPITFNWAHIDHIKRPRPRHPNDTNDEDDGAGLGI